MARTRYGLADCSDMSKIYARASVTRTSRLNPGRTAGRPLLRGRRQGGAAVCALQRVETVEALYVLSERSGPVTLASKRDAYFRIPRSAEVSASENAGRAKSRSAYFISGAACLGIWMP